MFEEWVGQAPYKILQGSRVNHLRFWGGGGGVGEEKGGKKRVQGRESTLETTAIVQVRGSMG